MVTRCSVAAGGSGSSQRLVGSVLCARAEVDSLVAKGWGLEVQPLSSPCSCLFFATAGVCLRLPQGGRQPVLVPRGPEQRKGVSKCHTNAQDVQSRLWAVHSDPAGQGVTACPMVDSSGQGLQGAGPCASVGVWTELRSQGQG